jgi:MFS family permease
MNATQTTCAAAPLTGPRSFWRTVKQFPRPVWILFAGTFINKFGTFVVPFLALHLTRLGYTAGEAGLGLVAYGAGHLTASILGGHLADTIGRRKTIVLSMFSGAASMLLLSQAHSLPAVLVLAYLTGLTAEFYKPASSALLADLVSAEHRVTAYAAYRFAINAGWAIGPAVGGFLAGRGYFWLFVGDAATALAFGLIALLFLPRERGTRPGNWSFATDAFTSVAQAARVAARDARFVQLVLATLAVGLVFVQMPTTLGLEIRAAGYSESIYGLVLAVNGVVVVLCEIPSSIFLQRLPPRPVIACGFALIGCGMGLNAWADEPWKYIFAMVVLTSGEILSMSVSLAYAARLAPEAMRGRYMGLYGLTWATALTCGPGLGLWTFARHPTALWIACWLMGLLAAVIVGGRMPARRSLAAVHPAG